MRLLPFKMRHGVDIVIVAYLRRAPDGGWIPAIKDERGRDRFTWRAKGYDHDVAARLAIAEANEYAARWGGDYRTKVLDRTRSNARRGRR